MMRALPKLADAAYPLYALAYLVSDEDELVRERYSWAAAITAIDCIRYIDRMNHLQICPSCARRAHLANFISERTPQESP